MAWGNILIVRLVSSSWRVGGFESTEADFSTPVLVNKIQLLFFLNWKSSFFFFKLEVQFVFFAELHHIWYCFRPKVAGDNVWLVAANPPPPLSACLSIGQWSHRVTTQHIILTFYSQILESIEIHNSPYMRLRIDEASHVFLRAMPVAPIALMLFWSRNNFLNPSTIHLLSSLLCAFCQSRWTIKYCPTAFIPLWGPVDPLTVKEN